MKGSGRENVCKHLLYLLAGIILPIRHCVAVQSPCHFICILIEFNVEKGGKGNGEEETGSVSLSLSITLSLSLSLSVSPLSLPSLSPLRDTNTNMGCCNSFP